MVRNQSQPCCPGTMHMTKGGKGEEKAIGDMSIYISRPSGPIHGGIVVNYDIFGLDVHGTRTFCDRLAEHGFYVIMPDYFRGKPWPVENFPPPNRSIFMNWIHSMPWPTLQQDLQHTKQYMEKEIPHLPLGLLGFCWGGKVAVHGMSDPSFRACVLCHASFLEEKDAMPVQGPILFLDAKNDPDREPLLKHLREKAFGMKCHSVKFQTMEHGWTIRGDSSDSHVHQAMEQAFQQTLQFFQDYLN